MKNSYNNLGGGNIRKLWALGNFLTVLGILIIFSSTILPLVKLPQTLVKKGPDMGLVGSNKYWIDTFILPTIDNETQVLLNLKGDHAGGVGITIIAYNDGTPVVGATPIINYIFETDQDRLIAQTITTMKSEYFISIVTIRNNYTLTIQSIWSPYDSLRAYLYLGLSMLPAGILIIYYDKILEKRDEILQSASNK